MFFLFYDDGVWSCSDEVFVHVNYKSIYLRRVPNYDNYYSMFTHSSCWYAMWTFALWSLAGKLRLLFSMCTFMTTRLRCEKLTLYGHNMKIPLRYFVTRLRSAWLHVKGFQLWWVVGWCVAAVVKGITSHNRYLLCLCELCYSRPGNLVTLRSPGFAIFEIVFRDAACSL